MNSFENEDREIREIEYVNFGVFSAEEILKISVAKIHETKLSGPGSVYDDRLGINSNNSANNCVTCNLSSIMCPGHFGHIELNESIVHPKYFKIVLAYLKCFCVKCNKMLVEKEQLQLAGFFKYKRNIRFAKIQEYLKKIDLCFSCGVTQPKFVYVAQDSIIKTIYKNNTEIVDIPLSTRDIAKIFDNISDEDVETLGFNPKLIHPRNLIISNLLVIPPCARPEVISDGDIHDDDLTIQYVEIIKINGKLLLPEENSDDSKAQKNIQTLRFRISTLFDNSQGKAKHSTNAKAIKGIKERISGKDGQIRNNLMGKRCEQTARTVIGPEPTLRTDQLAVPIEIAANLTVKETVTNINKEYLKTLVYTGKANFIIKKGKKNRINLKYALYTQGTVLLYGDILVRNGQEMKYIGQQYLTLKEGDKIIRNGEFLPLITFPKPKKFELEIGDIVERQLRNGDVVLLNRQPTLHKGSMMAKQIVIMPGKTLRFNLPSTKSFNADFDGDEMNIHVPQTPESIAELLNLSSTKHNIITAQTSKPNIVIVQDSLLGAFIMTKGYLKMDKDVFFNIANRAIQTNGDLLTVKHILDRIQHIRKILKLKGKKIQAFTGKGLFSLCLPTDFNYENKNEADPNEPIVKIYKGVLYEGCINKTDVGPVGNSIIQLLYKEYGGDDVITFIDNIQFVTNHWFTHFGFSVGIKDCIATKTEEINAVVQKCFMEAKGIEETTFHEGIKEIRVNAALSKARDMGLRIAKNALDPSNGFLATVTSGSKGDFFNIAQITGLLGQQNLGGQRVPCHLNRGKRTLPHYPFGELPKETEYESRGFIKHSFIHGLNPQEFYFHAMSGREGITDTAMGTSKSGYIQRRIVKVMEDISVKYDGTVRSVEGNIYQFAYGDDGFDPAESIVKKGVAQACDVGHLIDRLNMEFE